MSLMVINVKHKHTHTRIHTHGTITDLPTKEKHSGGLKWLNHPDDEISSS